MEWPTVFKQNVEGAFPQGSDWLRSLPQSLQEFERSWKITLGPPFELSFNFVASAIDANGNSVVLKAGVPTSELTSEIQALQLYDGDGAVRLLDCDHETGVLLMERLAPGHSLASLANDDEATRIAARLMRKLWRPLPADHHFPTVRRWSDGLQSLRRRFGGSTGPFPKRLVEMAERIFEELLSTAPQSTLLHGDFHHMNILLGKNGWTAIDPKGVAGEPSYEVGALLRNPNPVLSTNVDVQRRRLAILTEELGFDKRRLLGYAIAHTVLSAWWSFEDSGRDWEAAIACAGTLERLSP